MEFDKKKIKVAIKGNDFCMIFGTNKAKIELVERKWSKTRHIWPFWTRKSRFLDFFNVALELFKKCLGIVFDLKRATFGGTISSKSL